MAHTPITSRRCRFVGLRTGVLSIRVQPFQGAQAHGYRVEEALGYLVIVASPYEARVFILDFYPKAPVIESPGQFLFDPAFTIEDETAV